eukprot:SM000126S26331  [mRNA]  locus=s126:191483:192013:- [translate_table: standard]
MLTYVFMAWFVLSGWFFRLFFLSFGLLSLAGPLLLRRAATSAIVEGTCSTCGRKFLGPRRQVVLCSQCRQVVWRPRKDHSAGTAADIIDVDPL